MNTTILNFVGLPLDVEYRCRINRVPGGEVAQCVAELKQVGFYRYTLPENLEKALCDPLESLDDYGYVFFDYINRDTRMDTEDINEYGIG